MCLTSEEIPKERVFERGDRRINEEKRKKRKKRNRKKTRWRNVGGETNCRRCDVSRREIEQESIDRVCFSLYIALALLHTIQEGRKEVRSSDQIRRFFVFKADSTRESLEEKRILWKLNRLYEMRLDSSIFDTWIHCVEVWKRNGERMNIVRINYEKFDVNSNFFVNSNFILYQFLPHSLVRKRLFNILFSNKFSSLIQNSYIWNSSKSSTSKIKTKKKRNKKNNI